MAFTFLLIHSPLVGPMTWRPASGRLAASGNRVVVPRLSNPATPDTSYLEHHRRQVLDQIPDSVDGPHVVVGHSGAGALLPLLGKSLGNRSRLVFVDSGLPRKGRSRFDLFPDGLADRWRTQAVDDRLPATWTERNLSGLIVDDGLRKQFSSELRPTPIKVYEEPMPLDPPCDGSRTAYVLLSAPYSEPYLEAKRLGWVLERRDSTHCHMLNDPEDMAEILRGVADQII